MKDLKHFLLLQIRQKRGQWKLKLPLCLLLLLILYPVSSQEMDFDSYTSGAWVVDVVEQGEYIWAANWRGGIVRKHKVTGEENHYNFANSNLPTNAVNCLAVDQDGIVWAGTRNGLVRFDGEDWFVYNRTNSPLVALDYITAIIVDKNNNLWIGLQSSILYKFDRNNSWTLYNQNNSGIPFGWITSLAEDLDGSIWIGMDLGGGLVHFDGVGWTRYNTGNSGLPQNSVYHVSIGPNGEKWIASFFQGQGGLSRFDGQVWETLTPQNSPIASRSVNTLAITEEGDLWIGSDEGLQFYDGNSWLTFNTDNSPFPGNVVTSLFLSESTDLWVGFVSAVSWEDTVDVDTIACLLLKNDAGWNLFNTGNSQLANNWVEQIYFDEKGAAWIATYGGGISYFDGENWDWYHLGNSPLEGSYISHLMIDKSERVWISIDGYGLTVKDGTNWMNFNPLNSGFPSFRPMALVEAIDSSIWIGTSNGSIVRYDGATWKTYPTTETSLPNKNINELLFDKEHNLWVNHFYAPGIYQFKDSTWSVFNTSNSNIPSDFIAKTDIDTSGNIWVATQQGLGRYDGIDWEVFHTGNSPLPSNNIKSLKVVNGHQLWISTIDGFVFFDGIDQWILFPGIFSGSSDWENDPICMNVSPSGEIWVGSFNGILLGKPIFLPPTITLSTQELSFDSTLVGNCVILNYELSGTNLSETLNIIGSEDFQLALHPDSTFNPILTVIPESSSLERTIYVRFCPNEVKNYLDLINHESEEIGQVSLPVSGIGFRIPELWISKDELQFDSVLVGECMILDYSMAGSDLIEDVLIMATPEFQLTNDIGSAFMTSLLLTPEDGLLEETIYVRFCPSDVDFYLDSILHISAGINSVSVLVSGIGYSNPDLLLSEEYIMFDNVSLGNCDLTSYQLTGSWLISDLVITVAEGFSLALHPEDLFENMLTLSPDNGSLESTIYVRFCPVLAQTYSENIMHNSDGLAEALLKVEGIGYLMTGIEENDHSRMFSIYPNPADKELYIKHKGIDALGDITIEWLQVNGRLLEQRAFRFSLGDELILDISNYDAGTYILRITSDKQSFSKIIQLFR